MRYKLPAWKVKHISKSCSSEMIINYIQGEVPGSLEVCNALSPLQLF